MTRAVAPPSPTSTRAELHLELELEPDSDSALLRVVSALHRRRCRVVRASFSGGTGECDRLELQVLAPGLYPLRVEHWLTGLIDVRSAVARASD